MKIIITIIIIIIIIIIKNNKNKNNGNNGNHWNVCPHVSNYKIPIVFKSHFQINTAVSIL